MIKIKFFWIKIILFKDTRPILGNVSPLIHASLIYLNNKIATGF